MSIKKTPDDFRVDELLDPGFTFGETAGPFALYRLTKTGMGTPEAIGKIAKHWMIRHAALAYAGLKDKHAKSTQHLTLDCAQFSGKAPEREAGPYWSIERLGYCARAIRSSDLAGNRFRIVVRSLTPEDSRDMDRAAALLRVPGREPAALRFVNYFGDQRFGSARHGEGFLARNLIDGDFETALRLAVAVEHRKDHRDVKAFKRALLEGWGRWQEVLPKLRHCPERKAFEHLARHPQDYRGAFTQLPYFLQQICVYAYQSHLWNSVARGLAAQCEGGREDRIVAEDPYGVMLFPAALTIPAEWEDLNVPLLSRKTELRAPWGETASEVLAEENLKLEDLRIPGVRRPFFGEAPRKLFVEARGFELGPAEKEEGGGGRLMRVASFELPPGAYATVLLRALGE
ncbi:MAG: tRNA pseudouridine(13) synthase TruD [Planctomycetes bacterium]|nr:tRNA pseudouridine(13) synthase TruD [Planctomycetota bacterium]